jgi:hypothetical protein
VSLGVMRAVLLVLATCSAFALAAGPAAACVCVKESMSKRLDDADAAVVGRVLSRKTVELRGQPQLLQTVDVQQRVKGRGLHDPIVVRTPLHTDCDVHVRLNRTVGWLLTKAPNGTLLASQCSIVGPAALVAAGGEPRGGVIKVIVGFFILALVLLWALRRLRRGTRPRLPGAPTP